MGATRASWEDVLREPPPHLAQLYLNPKYLGHAAGLFLAEGARVGDTIMMIVTPEHEATIRAGMRQYGVDPDELAAAGRLMLYDAKTTAERYVPGGVVDRALIDDEFGATLTRLNATGRVRAYGELVLVLWRTGQASAAVELEQVWSALIARHRISVMCGYHLDTFPVYAHACREHAQVLPSEQFIEQGAIDRLGLVAHLEQEARGLRAQDRLIKNIVECSRDCIKVLDLDARLVFMNEGGMAALEVFDFSALRSTSWLDLWHGADRCAAAKAFESARDGQSAEFSGYFETLLRKRPAWWHVVMSPICDDTGRVDCVLAVSREVTDRKRIEDDLRESVEARDQLLSVASHELRTPVTSLQLQIEMVRASVAESATVSPENLAQIVEVTGRQIQRLAALVDSMHSVATIHAGKLKLNRIETDLSTVIMGACERMRERFAAVGSTVTTELAQGLVGTWDVTRLEEVVERLFANAIRYAPGTTVAVTTCGIENGVEIVVADHGPGIPSDKHDAIFERFERIGAARSHGNLGVGLFIVRQLVDAHGGRVYVRATEGGGATFVIELPLTASSHESQPEQDP